jgi:hypothetical protein
MVVKGVLAGLAAVTAAIAVFQLQGDGGAGTGPESASAAPDAGLSSAPEPPADSGGGARLAPAGGAPAGSRPDAPLRFPTPRDGGTVYLGDAPGRVRASADADAGSADGGSGSDAGAGAQSDEVQRLRERVARLEQELARSRSDAQTQELERLNQQVATLRDQLAQEQGRRQQEELAAQQGKAREQEAASALAAAQQRLAYGDSNVLDTLESASGSFPAPVQSAVQSARTAVQNGDLAGARYWISIALSEEQKRLVNH